MKTLTPISFKRLPLTRFVPHSRSLTRLRSSRAAGVLGKFADHSRIYLEKNNLLVPLSTGHMAAPIRIADVSGGKLLLFHAKFTEIVGESIRVHRDLPHEQVDLLVFAKLQELANKMIQSGIGQLKTELKQSAVTQLNVHYFPIPQINFIDVESGFKLAASLCVGLYLGESPIPPNVLGIAMNEVRKFSQDLIPPYVYEEIQRRLMRVVQGFIPFELQFTSGRIFFEGEDCRFFHADCENFDFFSPDNIEALVREIQANALAFFNGVGSDLVANGVPPFKLKSQILMSARQSGEKVRIAILYAPAQRFSEILQEWMKLYWQDFIG